MSSSYTLNFIIYVLQAGEFRDSARTKQTIYDQFMCAMQPSSKTTLENLVRDAGVRDTLSQPLLDSLVHLSTTLWNDEQQMEYASLQRLLSEELQKLKSMGPIHNPLLDMKGAIP